MGKIFTCEEVAKRYRVKIGTVWEWIRNKKLKAFRIGNRYRIREEALEEFEKNA